MDDATTVKVGDSELQVSDLRIRQFSRACLAGVVIISGSVLLGWVLTNPTLKSVLPGYITMKANTALCFELLALALFISTTSKANRTLAHIGSAAALLAAGIALATLLEYLTRRNFGLDEWLFADPDGYGGAFPPGRPAPITCINFLLLAFVAIFGADHAHKLLSKPAYRATQLAAFVCCLAALQSLVGYLCGVTNLFGGAFYMQMAIHTSVSFALLGLSFLTATADDGYMPILFAKSIGGSTLRRLIGAVVCVPILVAWVDVHMQRLGYFDADLGVLFRLLGNISFFTIIIWKTASWLHHLDGKRREAEAFILQANTLLQGSLAREKAARLELEALLAEAQQLHRAKDEFLATLSHELRTPLTIINGWSQVLNIECQESVRLDAVRVIQQQTTGLGQIIDDLLDMSTLIAGQQILSQTEVNLASVVEKALASVQLAATSKGVTIQAHLAIDSVVLGCSKRLLQILWNLLANAVKYTPRGGSVSVELEPGDSDEVCLKVKDSGSGIAPGFLPHIFERFRQEDGSTRREHPGLGIGLAITRSLVELHGGTITAASPGKGQGATFVVTLPAAHSPVDAPIRVQTNSPAGSLAQPALAASRKPLSGLNVLVVDDAPDTLKFIELLLKRYGAEVQTADSVLNALAIFKSRRPDVMISDIGMPVQDGYDLIRQIRALESSSEAHLPAAALTAFVQDVERRRALEAGFQAHLAKPVKAETLVETIINLVRPQKQVVADDGASLSCPAL